MINDAVVEALVKIANHSTVIKMTEPNVAFPQQISDWMVVRTLASLSVFQDEWDKVKKAK